MATTLTRPVGDIFDYKGARLKVVRYDGIVSHKCLTCYLNSLSEFNKESTPCQVIRESPEMRSIFGYCGYVRTDGNQIIFVKQEDTITKLNLTE